MKDGQNMWSDGEFQQIWDTFKNETKVNIYTCHIQIVEKEKSHRIPKEREKNHSKLLTRNSITLKTMRGILKG